MEGPSEDLRLPTTPVAVHLVRAGHPRERAELFVAVSAARPRRSRAGLASDVAELLEAEPAFVPVREPDAPGGARIALVGKHAIVWVAVSLRGGEGAAVDGVPAPVDDEPSDALALYDHHHGVRVELAGFDAIEGHVLYSSPADRPRLVDHLNLPVRFLRVWTGSALYLINKHHVVRVLELD
ncbi:MAG: hypothetical protein H6708_29530 [Kofleriaceae bacterium]|nr:hypothetical protein [Kofleriaceae bacterium]